MPVATRMKNVLRVSAPRYQVGLNSNARDLILTENRWRNTFCCTACARCRLLSPLPLRKIERHASVLRRFRSEFQCARPDLDRKQMEKHILLHRLRAMQIAVAIAASED